jgi:hypothetical protein
MGDLDAGTDINSAHAREESAARRFQQMLGGKVLTDLEMARDAPIDGVIHSGLTAVIGQPFQGKTTLVLSMLKALLDGSTEWNGYRVEFQATEKVLFYAENRRGYQRAKALQHAYPGRVIVLQTEHLRTTDVSHAEVTRLIAEESVGLIVIDSAFRAVGDLNDHARATDFTNELGLYGVPILVIHHSPKPFQGNPDPERPSGSQAWDSAYEQLIHLSSQRPSGYQTLTIRGNDVPEKYRVDVVIDHDSLSVTRYDGPISSSRRKAESSSKPQRLADGEQAAILARLSHAQGIDGRLNHNQITSQLLGGTRSGGQDAARQRAVSEALGGVASGFRSISDKVRNNRAVFDKEYVKLSSEAEVE